MNFLPDDGRRKQRQFKINLTLTPKQKEIDANFKRFNIVRAGRKFGKTVYARKKMLDWLGPANSVVWNISPTYKQGKLIAWDDIKRTIPEEAMAKKPNDQDLMITLKNGSRLYLMGSDDPDSLRGPAPTGVIFEEAAYHKAGVWEEVIRPNLAVHKAPALFISSPNGYNWFKDLEDEAKRLIESGDKDWATFHYTMYDNPYIDPEEIKKIKAQCDNQAIWNQEYMALYESSVGRVFNSFQDKEPHTSSVIVPRGTFDSSRGIDWGMRDGTGCVWGFVKGRTLFVYREHMGKDLSAPQQASIIKSKTTSNENVKNTAISHDAVKQDPAMRGLTVMWHFMEAGIRPIRPSSRDKKSSRAMLQQLFQENRIVIDKECRKLRKQLLAYEWKDTEMEKTVDGNDHLVDALHYLVELLQYDLFLADRSEKKKTMSEIYAEIRAEKAQMQRPKLEIDQSGDKGGYDFAGSAAGYL